MPVGATGPGVELRRPTDVIVVDVAEVETAVDMTGGVCDVIPPSVDRRRPIALRQVVVEAALVTGTGCVATVRGGARPAAATAIALELAEFDVARSECPECE